MIFKVIAIALMFIGFSNASHSKEFGALPSLNEYCSKENSPNSSRCLFAYLTYRCTVNFFVSDPMYVSKCIEGVSALVSELNLTQVSVPDDHSSSDSLKLHQVAFSKKLIKNFLVPSENFKNKIEQYQNEFEDSYRFAKENSLWTRTLSDAKDQKEKALETMVTIFQDFSSKGYFDFIDQAVRNSSSRTKQVAHSNLMTLNSFYDSLLSNRISRNLNPNYSIYPNIIGADQMSTVVHHFYTPAYLSLRLKKLGFDQQLAFFVSFLFNTSYEFTKLDQKMKTHRWPYRDPVAFDAQKY